MKQDYKALAERLTAVKLGHVLDKLASVCGADKAVARYAAEDARRFGHA